MAAMTTILPTIDGPYPTTNSPPPTTNLAPNVCEALRRLSLCEARDVKDKDELVDLAYSLFSGKQLPAVMFLELRKQNPYLMLWMACICCARNICYRLNGKETMLARCQGKQAHNQEVTGGLTTLTWCRFSPHEYVVIYMLLEWLAITGFFPV